MWVIAETKDLREQIQTREKTAADLDARLGEILSGIPNIPHASVPVGNSAEQNENWGPLRRPAAGNERQSPQRQSHERRSQESGSDEVSPLC